MRHHHQIHVPCPANISRSIPVWGCHHSKRHHEFLNNTFTLPEDDFLKPICYYLSCTFNMLGWKGRKKHSCDQGFLDLYSREAGHFCPYWVQFHFHGDMAIFSCLLHILLLLKLLTLGDREVSGLQEAEWNVHYRHSSMIVFFFRGRRAGDTHYKAPDSRLLVCGLREP